MRMRAIINKYTLKIRILRSIYNYYLKFERYAFEECSCDTPEQFCASITRLYHTIEKGLSYKEYRAGFGKDNITKLIITLEQYRDKGFDTSAFFYEAALSCLEEYMAKNALYGITDKGLCDRVKQLGSKSNGMGGTIEITKNDTVGVMSYEEIISSRHSIRHFSCKPIDMESVIEAIRLAQYTPSACNRQGWRTIIVAEKKTIREILANQNGNKGFGQEIDKLLIVLSSLQAQQRSREVFQAFIDGGMYAENLLNLLYYKGIGTIPLSAALSPVQEKNVRNIIGIDDSEVLIMFIGLGNYPDEKFLTTMSKRRPANIQVISESPSKNQGIVVK